MVSKEKREEERKRELRVIQTRRRGKAEAKQREKSLCSVGSEMCLKSRPSREGESLYESDDNERWERQGRKSQEDEKKKKREGVSLVLLSKILNYFREAIRDL